MNTPPPPPTTNVLCLAVGLHGWVVRRTTRPLSEGVTPEDLPITEVSPEYGEIEYLPSTTTEEEAFEALRNEMAQLMEDYIEDLRANIQTLKALPSLTEFL